MGQVDAEVGVSKDGASGKLGLNFRVPHISKLKICEDNLIPDWQWGKLKHEKWIVHRWPNGVLEQKRVGESNPK